MRCDICNKEVDRDCFPCPKETFEKIGYRIPKTFIKGAEMIDISGKIKGKKVIIVGRYCECDKRIAIALKRIGDKEDLS